MKIGDTFVITYFAKKHGKFITRSGKWVEGCREFTTTVGNKATVYYDTDELGYRTAIGEPTITMKG